jgi:hypothetical protein
LSGRKVFTAGEVLQAADVNDFLMDQSVMVFAGTAARGSAIPSPTEGMVTYLEDSDELQVYTTDWGAVGVSPAILQVVQDIKTDSYTESVAGSSFSSEITGLSATITPSSTSSKILVMVAVGGVYTVSGIKLLINGSDSAYIGDTSGSRGRASSAATFGTSTTIVYLHSPASTSAQTYTIKIQNQESSTQTLYFNTTSIDQLRVPTTASSITLMEVAG